MTYQEAIDKVAKLMRKGQDPRIDPKEAALFMAKAQQIMDEYNLDVDSINYDSEAAEQDKEEVKDFGYADPLDNIKYGNYRESWMTRLASIVARHNGCIIRYLKTGASGKDVTIRIVGRPSDVQTTRYLYYFFRNQIVALQGEHCKGNSSAYKGEFCVGCTDTLYARLKEQREATIEEIKSRHTNNPLALVRVSNAVARIDKRREDVDDFMNKDRYESLAWLLDCPVAVARLICKGRREEAKALVSNDDTWKALIEAYERYLKDLSKMSGGRGGPRGFSGAGARTYTGGREAGREAGNKIRMTSAKAGLGSGRKEIE